jgi:hypothetical protein
MQIIKLLNYLYIVKQNLLTNIIYFIPLNYINKVKNKVFKILKNLIPLFVLNMLALLFFH